MSVYSDYYYVCTQCVHVHSANIVCSLNDILCLSLVTQLLYLGRKYGLRQWQSIIPVLAGNKPGILYVLGLICRIPLGTATTS